LFCFHSLSFSSLICSWLLNSSSYWNHSLHLFRFPWIHNLKWVDTHNSESCYYYLHSTDEETEASPNKATCLPSHHSGSTACVLTDILTGAW
jgi:hypothetical protein